MNENYGNFFFQINLKKNKRKKIRREMISMSCEFSNSYFIIINTKAFLIRFYNCK